MIHAAWRVPLKRVLFRERKRRMHAHVAEGANAGT
jgi:hypothetical protein